MRKHTQGVLNQKDVTVARISGRKLLGAGTAVAGDNRQVPWYVANQETCGKNRREIRNAYI